MKKVVLGSVILTLLAGCAGDRLTGGTSGSEGNAAAVCNEQSVWAQSGKVDNGDITITCPGDARPTY